MSHIQLNGFTAEIVWTQVTQETTIKIKNSMVSNNSTLLSFKTLGTQSQNRDVTSTNMSIVHSSLVIDKY